MDWYVDIVATIALGLSGRAFLQERKAKLEPQLDLEPLPPRTRWRCGSRPSGRWITVLVRLRVVQPPENLRPPIEAVMFEHVWGQEVDLGPLRRGEAAEVLLRREEGRTSDARPVRVHLPEPVRPGRCWGQSGLKDPAEVPSRRCLKCYPRPSAINDAIDSPRNMEQPACHSACHSTWHHSA